MNFILFLSLFITVQASAHGTENLGPHGGYIQMPGAFHTELFAEANGNVRIYLLDMEFNNPTVENSTAEVISQHDKKTVHFNCQTKEKSYFYCIPKEKYSKSGQLIVRAKRQGAKGNEAIYNLPLSK